LKQVIEERHNYAWEVLILDQFCTDIHSQQMFNHLAAEFKRETPCSTYEDYVILRKLVETLDIEGNDDNIAWMFGLIAQPRVYGK